MIVDHRAPGRAPLHTAEATAVVGSGAAGIALALALARRGTPVLLVESGGDPRDADGVEAASQLNEGEVLGQRYDGLTQARARVLGGATQRWHGQCVRLHPEDLAARAWVPGSGWPTGFAALERWYPAAEEFLGLTGRGYDARRWAEHPRLRPLAWDERNLLHDFTEYAPRPHLGSVHRAELRRSRTVTVLQHATVSQVLVRGGRARGVEVLGRDGHRAELAVRHVVLAAGAVENARILLLSDPAGVGLGTGARHTGRWLQDHAKVVTADVELLPGRPALELQDRYAHLHRRRRRLYPKVRLAPAAAAREQLLSANAVFVFTRDEDDLAAARRVAQRLRGARADAGGGGLRTDLAAAARVPGPLLRTAYRRYARGLSAGTAASGTAMEVWLEQAPRWESRVVLSAERDALGLPRAAVDWRLGELEVRTSRRLTQMVAADLERLGVARLRERDLMSDDAAWFADVTDAYHPSGTTRMSSDPAGGVVDADLGVHGVAGLSVVGSSAFPAAGHGNPTLTIVALALRLAEHLAPTRDRAQALRRRQPVTAGPGREARS